jgi:uncharacterized repeat protein (TIGR01451 family)
VKHKGLFLLMSTLLVLASAPAGALAVTSAPSITSSFTPSTIASGGTSTLSFTITNNDSGSGITGVGFTDTLPSGVTVATSSGASGSCGGGTFTATAGASTITLTGGTIAAGGTCTVSASVTSSTGGTAQNSTGSVTSNEDGTGNSDTKPLTVVTAPTIASAFTPGLIATGFTSILSFTITNPTNKSLSGIAFTDTLPAGVAVDNPSGASAKCGTNAKLTAVAGSSTISLTGGNLAPGASCTVSANVTSTTPGARQNSTGAVSSTEGGSGAADTKTLTVVGPPTVTVTSPASNATYALGQRVIAKFSCQDSANAPGIQDCGGDVPSGSPIDTSTPGPNTFTVTAISNDGAATDQTISYTVLPDNRFKVSNVTPHSDGQVDFAITVPGPGKVLAADTAKIAGKTGHTPVRFGSSALLVTAAGIDDVTVRLTAAGRKLLHRAQAFNQSHAKRRAETVAVTLTVVFKPSSGTRRTLTVHGIVIRP